jgi:hypothetical protein
LDVGGIDPGLRELSVPVRSGARAAQNATDVGMMTSTGGEEDDLTIAEDGGDDGDVWQMRAARGWMIGHQDVALVDVALEEFDLVADGAARAQSWSAQRSDILAQGHRAEMDGQVRCLRSRISCDFGRAQGAYVGDEVAIRRKDGAREVQTPARRRQLH